MTARRRVWLVWGVALLHVTQSVLLVGLLFHALGESTAVSHKVDRGITANNAKDCQLYQSLLPRKKAEQPDTDYGKRIVASLEAKVREYHCPPVKGR